MAAKFIHTLISIILFHIPSNICLCQMNPGAIVEKLLDKRAAHQSIQYDILFKFKKYLSDDTAQLTAKVKLVRIPQDTLFHGLFLIDLAKDTAWYGYDREKIFKRHMLTNEVTYSNALTNPGFLILSHIRYNLVDDGFLNLSTGLRQIIDDPQYDCHFTDNFIEGVHCLGLSFKLPDQGEEVNRKIFVAIDTAELFIRKKTFSVYFQGNEQYQEWNYSNVRFGQDSIIPELDWKTYGPGVKDVQYVREDFSAIQVADFDWSSLQGKIFNSEERVALKNVPAKFIILDFWYSSCYPCMKSIPLVGNIARKYDRKDVAVFGANMIDHETSDKSRLDKIFMNNPMPYPTIMLDPDLSSKLNLYYPTFIILNDRFEVIYYEDVYNENLESEVTAFLEERIHK